MRVLLPRGTVPQPPIDPSSSTRQGHAITACDSCRRLKTRCDGKRPKCWSCIRRGRQCHYSTDPFESRQVAEKRRHEELVRSLQDREAIYEPLRKVIHALRTSSEPVAAAIFESLRDGAAIESILQQHTADPIIQTRLSPEVKLRYVFPYRTRMPRALQVATNPYLDTMLYEAAYSGDDASTDQTVQYQQKNKFASPYEKPYSASTMMDDRLDSVKPSEWTMVAVADGVGRIALRRYFLYEYQFFSGFHKDLFLDDMLSGSPQYCSSLLVNAVLALSCNCCPTVPSGIDFWDPQKLGYLFFAEARRLWDLAMRSGPSITTVQAGVILSIIYDMYALDKIGMEYLMCSIHLAHNLGLFNAQAPGIATSDPRRWAGEGFTAWSVYFWTSLRCNMLGLPPLCAIAPEMVLPDPDNNPNWYGDSRVRYPSDETLYSLYHPHFFKNKCQLAIIMNDLGTRMFDNNGNRITAPSEQVLGQLLTRLGAWRFALPPKLKETYIVFPFELNLHLVYLSTTINIGELLVGSIDYSEASSTGFSRANLEHAKICLETVMRLYYLRHGFEIPDGHLSHCSIVLAYKGLSRRYLSKQLCESGNDDKVSQEEARSTLVLAAKALADQGRNYYLPRALYDIVEHEMSPNDRNLLGQYVTVGDPSQESLQIRQNYISSLFPVGVSYMIDLEDRRRLDHLKKEIPNLAEERAKISSDTSSDQ